MAIRSGGRPRPAQPHVCGWWAAACLGRRRAWRRPRWRASPHRAPLAAPLPAASTAPGRTGRASMRRARRVRWRCPRRACGGGRGARAQASPSSRHLRRICCGWAHRPRQRRRLAADTARRHAAIRGGGTPGSQRREGRRVCVFSCLKCAAQGLAHHQYPSHTHPHPLLHQRGAAPRASGRRGAPPCAPTPHQRHAARRAASQDEPWSAARHRAAPRCRTS